VPAPKYFRLFPGNTVRLKYGYVVKCTGFKKDDAGNVVEVQCEYMPDSKSGTPGADNYKGEGRHSLGVREVGFEERRRAL
jgi:glutaminyl-tRNA synthetase